MQFVSFGQKRITGVLPNVSVPDRVRGEIAVFKSVL